MVKTSNILIFQISSSIFRSLKYQRSSTLVCNNYKDLNTKVWGEYSTLMRQKKNNHDNITGFIVQAKILAFNILNLQLFIF